MVQNPVFLNKTNKNHMRPTSHKPQAAATARRCPAVHPLRRCRCRRRPPPGAVCASILKKKHFFTKIIQLQTTSRGRYRPDVHPQRRRRRRRRRSPPAGRRPPTADHRPPTADRRPPRRRQAKRTSSRRHRPGCRGGAGGRRETTERRALDAAGDLVAVRASALRVGKNKRF